MQRFGIHLPTTPEKDVMLKERLSNVLAQAMFLAKFIPGLGVLTSFVSGVSRLSRRAFLRPVTGQLLAWEGRVANRQSTGRRRLAFDRPLVLPQAEPPDH